MIYYIIKKGEETESLNACTAITGKAIDIFGKRQRVHEHEHEHEHEFCA